MSAIYRLSLPRRLVNALARPLIRLGLSGQMHLLVVRGRRTGRLYSTPVKLVERDGARWLVAPYGERSWVKNARAAGSVELRHGRAGAARVPALNSGDAEVLRRARGLAPGGVRRRGVAPSRFPDRERRTPLRRALS